MAIVNKQDCVTKKCDTCSFFQIQSTSVESGAKADTVVAICKPNYVLIGGLVALIIVAPILYKKYKN
jgi:hypothetical protein